MTTPEPSPYRIKLEDLEAEVRVADEDRVEEQDVSPGPASYAGDGDVPGHPGVRNGPDSRR